MLLIFINNYFSSKVFEWGGQVKVRSQVSSGRADQGAVGREFLWLRVKYKYFVTGTRSNVLWAEKTEND